jgi:hypothetical protein
MPSSEGDGVGAGVADKYEIRLAGRLDARWAAWFDGLDLTHEGAGITVIHGPVADQTALHGLLRKVRDLGLPLISVTRVDSARPDGPTIEPDHVLTHARKEQQP